MGDRGKRTRWCGVGDAGDEGAGRATIVMKSSTGDDGAGDKCDELQCLMRVDETSEEGKEILRFLMQN